VLVRDGLVPAWRSVTLAQYVRANLIHERSNPFWLSDARFLPQGHKNPSERLLPDIFDVLRRMQPRSQLQMNQLAEIGNKMFLRPEVTRTQPLEIGAVESLKLQVSPSKLWRSFYILESTGRGFLALFLRLAETKSGSRSLFSQRTSGRLGRPKEFRK